MLDRDASLKSLETSPRGSSEGTDFGQSRFGHPDLTDSGQSILGQSNTIQFFGQHLWCHGEAPKGGGPNPEKVGAPKGGAPKGGGSNDRWEGGRGKGPRVGAQNFAFFFSFPATVFYSFFPLFWSFRGILVVFEAVMADFGQSDFGQR